MCENILKTLVAEPPARRIDSDRRKLPAGIFRPGIWSWLYQMSSLLHLGLLRYVFTIACVPFPLASTVGLSALQTRQKLNRRSSWVRKTICFGSVLRLVFLTDNLKYIKVHKNTNYIKWINIIHKNYINTSNYYYYDNNDNHDDDDYRNNSLHLVRKYAKIFVHKLWLLQEASSFLRA